MRVTLDLLADRLEGVRRNGGGLLARCPIHDDRSPSLSISPGDKATLVYCHAGCSTEEVMAALSLDVRDLYYDQGSEDHSGDRADLSLALRIAMSKVRPPDPWEGHVPTLGEVMRNSFHSTQPNEGARRMALTGSQHPYLLSLPFPSAWKMWHVISDGPLWTYLEAWWTERGVADWNIQKREAMTHMHKTWRERERWMRK